MREWRPGVKDETMNDDDEMRDEYDFSSGGVVGKYYNAVAHDRTVVQLDPDVAAEFPDSDAVNQTLRRVARARRRRRQGSQQRVK
jgi:hypothetical protein